jgi:Na+-transporting NADH:ubiquinone oxidoreductase subunit A
MAKLTQIKPDLIKLSLKEGLDLKISGKPEQTLQKLSPKITRVALLGNDYPGLKPSVEVKVGSKVKLGQVLVTDKANPEVKLTSPGTGTVLEINRGDKRKLLSVVIGLSGSGENTFKKYTPAAFSKIKRNEIVENLLTSGLWTAIRNRPFGHVPNPAEIPKALFINAADTNPHAPQSELFINKYTSEFISGIKILSKLTEGKTWVVYKAGMETPEVSGENLVKVEVNGPHPAGNVGTHIHFLDPVGPHKSVWYIGYQDVIAVGYLFKTGQILTERIVSIAGPASIDPAVVLTRLGASTDEIIEGRKRDGDVRVVSGSLLAGNIAADSVAYLGRYHQQVSLIHEGRERKLMGWMTLGFRKFSLKNIYLSAFIKPDSYDFDTSTNGSPRAIIPVGMFEEVMPLDIQPTYLLRTIMTGDIEYSEELGVLELEEEDLSLFSFVSPGKEDFGVILRTMLERIARGE